ncbi:MAG: ABC transporter substrate-binding protein [Marinisporobacter sp.]|jgi:putative spermidine/putrescine transport system substrate-binding protein|nr:ABC transporter substrate-binding protein [Marinisporobacter sp.]
MMKKLCALLILILVFTSIVGCSPKEEETNQLVISTWGYNEDKLWENVFKPFEEAHNVKIVLETGNNSERLTKLRTNPSNNVDIIYLAEAFAQEGAKEGLFEKIDYSKIPNAKKINEKAQYLVEQGYGPAYTLNRAAIAYDPTKVDFEIKSWKDLWNPALKGKVSIPEISTTFGPAAMYLASNKGGVDITTDNGETAFKELEALKPNLVKTYTKSSDLANMFANGEIAVAVAADFAFGRIKDGSKDAVFVDPEEGAYLNFNTINIVKNSKNKDLALQFIDYALSQEVQTKTAKALGESPVNVDVALSEEEAKNLTYGDKVEKGNIVEYTFVNSIKNQWVDTWNRILNQ